MLMVLSPGGAPAALRESTVDGTRLALLRDGAQAIPAMLAAIAEAKEQILLEMYWFASDRVGQAFAGALIAARRRGVEVALLYDSVGSMDSDPSIFSAMADAGVLVVEFNPILPWRKRFAVLRLRRRDHRKILVVDGHIGFTGGVNLEQRWLPSETGNSFRDDMLRLDGPAVLGLVDCFLPTWTSQGGPALQRLPDAVRPPTSARRVRILSQNSFRARREIIRTYLHNIRQASEYVWIANSYFVPDRRVVRALRAAARRGVDVRVLLPGTSDVPIVNHASRAVWQRLLNAGVRIYQWQINMLHSKTAVIDGLWSTIGTFNLDHMSLRFNLEVNVAIVDGRFAERMRAGLERDLELSYEVDRVAFRYRSLGDRLLEFLFYRFRRFL
jgi:cardiolipin synthase A/B